MNKLYACTQQGRTLLATILMLVLTPLSILTFGQSPCTSPVIREATNAKSTNSNVYDDITIAMTNLLGNGTEAAWVMEPGGTFTENLDGTARLQGTVKQFGDNVPPRRMAMDVILGGRSFTPDASGPYNQTGVPTDGWYYYHTLSGTFTGLDALDGGKLSLAIHMHPFQVGIGANQMFVAEDQVANGAGGWFEWTVVTQPTDNTLQFTNYIPGITISDFAMLLSGTPSEPCNPCANDTESPVLANCPTDITLTADCRTNQAIATWTVPTATDNCSTATVGSSHESGASFGEGTTVVTFTATDAAGNTSTCAFNVVVTAATDTESPVLVNCPTDITLTADCRTNKATATWTVPTATDNCSTATVSSSHTSGASFGEGTTVVTFTATDTAGNTATCAFNVVVTAATDTESPVLVNCPTDITLTADCRTNKATATWTVPTATDNCSTATVGSSHTSGASFGVGTTVVTFTATDAAGNTATCAFNVVVTAATDTESPVLVNCPTDITLTADCRTNKATATWTVPTATDNCSTATVSSSYTSGASFGIGTTVVKFTATDAAGNTATCSFSVIVKAAVDTTKPVFANCPTSIMKDVINSTSACWPIIWTAPTATDNCSVNVTSDHNSGDCFPVGLTVVTYTATDASGNIATCSFGVNIIKTTSCSVSGNTLTKSCVNNLPVLIGTALSSHEYIWVSSTTGCPTPTSPVIAGATGQNYTLPSRVSVTTYFARFARPIGCTTWASTNGSNCITVNANECAPVIVDSCTGVLSVRSVKNTLDNCGGSTGQPYVALFNGIYYTAGNDLKFTEYTNGTASLKGTIYTNNVAYWINMTFSGKATVSSGSPKIMLCATGQTTGSSWYYYTTTGGQINTPTGTYSLTRQGPAFQVGQFANLQQNNYGASGWFYGNGTVSGDVNFNLDPIEPCGTVTPPSCSGVGAAIYTDCGNAGVARYLTVGNYTLAQLNAMGVANDVISSVKVYPGFKITLYKDDNFTTSPFTLTTNVSCLIDQNYNDVTSSLKVECLYNTTPTSCTVTGNTVAKSCVNNLPVLTGSALSGHEYMWVSSTTGCPTPTSPVIAGATGQNYTLPSRVSVTTYFARFARPIGCTTWASTNGSNCITVNANECAPTVNCTVTGNTLTKACVNNLPVVVGTALANYEYVWLKSTTGCPTQSSQAIVGVTGQNYSLPSRVTVTTYFVRCARPIGCTTWGTVNESNCITVYANECAPTVNCTVSGNTISKSCVNNLPVITGAALVNYEYVWLKSTIGCPTQSSQAIVGATGQNYSLPSRVTVTTYFVRCARPIGCTTWGTVNESNCIAVNANECAPTVNCTVSGNTISKSCVNNLPVVTGAALANYEYVWLKSTTGCPTQSSQAIAGATGQNYSLPSRVTVATYFVRCARPIGCTTWGTVNESNCVTVFPTDCPATAICSINFSSTKSYRIVSKKSGKALDVYGSGTYNDCPIDQWSYNGTANQQWRLFSLGSGYFKVMARNSGKYLACHYTTNSSPVYQYDYYTGGYKDWKIECVGTTGYYRLIHRASGKVLDVTGGSLANGAKMNIYPWTGTDNQLFSIEEVAAAPAAYSASSTVLAMNATAESDRVRLSWMSNTGYDNDFYTVEKMNTSTGDFEKIALVNNEQFDDQVQTHVVNDAQPTEGDNFYRVKVTLNDGQEKVTDVKKVTFKRMIGFGAFPNPASDELNVNLSEYTGKAVDIVIYNSFGKVMSREHVDNVSNATHQLNISELAAGQYHIRVSSEGKRDATQPVIIQK